MVMRAYALEVCSWRICARPPPIHMKGCNAQSLVIVDSILLGMKTIGMLWLFDDTSIEPPICHDLLPEAHFNRLLLELFLGWVGKQFLQPSKEFFVPVPNLFCASSNLVLLPYLQLYFRFSQLLVPVFLFCSRAPIFVKLFQCCCQQLRYVICLFVWPD